LNTNDTYTFLLLKKEVFAFFSKNHSVPESFEKFGKDDIILFQEDLFDKVKAKVSEKWFYTYFKHQPEKLPRIDMLNLLCLYLGYQNWNAFSKQKSKQKSKKPFIILFALVLFILVFGFLIHTRTYSYNFCFVDDDLKKAISNTVDVEILLEGQSPLRLTTDDKGCLEFSSKADTISFVIKSNYYATDTIVRSATHSDGNIFLKVDDYALMLAYYSKGSAKNVAMRKAHLEKLIDTNAMIYQLYSNRNEVEIYSKSEFINLLTVPTKTLQNIHYLKKEYREDKIVKLKFMIK
jgi:hypothetical protein